MSTATSARWVVVVHLADGGQLFYAQGSECQGQEQWSPRVNQAKVFESREAAERAHGFQANAEAREYRVVRV